MLFAFCLSVVTSFSVLVSAQDSSSGNSLKTRVLLVTGGCCHDYDFQAKALQLAAEKRGANIEWTIVNEGGTGTEAEIPLYDNPDWADGFDVVIHNECFANTTSEDYIRRITGVHKQGVGAVVIHCAMHTYRAAKIDDWREFLGVTSRKHEHKSEYTVNVVNPKHAIMKGFPDGHQMPIDELYVIEKLWPKAKVLAKSTSEKTGEEHPVFWTNRYGKARVFGTTYGHSNETFGDQVFLDTVVRGTQWAANKRAANKQRAQGDAKKSKKADVTSNEKK